MMKDLQTESRWAGSSGASQSHAMGRYICEIEGEVLQECYQTSNVIQSTVFGH